MQTDNREKTLFRIRTGSLLVFYMLLIGGIAMVGLGAATHLILFMSDGAVILVASPIFLAMNQFAKRAERKLDVMKSGV